MLKVITWSRWSSQLVLTLMKERSQSENSPRHVEFWREKRKNLITVFEVNTDILSFLTSFPWQIKDTVTVLTLFLQENIEQFPFSISLIYSLKTCPNYTFWIQHESVFTHKFIFSELKFTNEQKMLTLKPKCQ